MELLKIVASILAEVAWPFTAIVITFLLKSEIRTILTRIESAKLPGGTEFKLMKFGDSRIDNPDNVAHAKIEKSVDENKINAKWENVANIFWLGNDLMWTIDALLRNADKRFIIHGLRQASHHLQEIKLTDSQYEEKMLRLLEKSDNTLESDWTVSKRELLAQDIQSLINELGEVSSLKQGNFRSRPRPRPS